MADDDKEPNSVARKWFWWTMFGAVLYVGGAFAIILFGGF